MAEISAPTKHKWHQWHRVGRIEQSSQTGRGMVARSPARLQVRAQHRGARPPASAGTTCPKLSPRADTHQAVLAITALHDLQQSTGVGFGPIDVVLAMG